MPAGWIEVHPGEDDPDFTFLAVNASAEDGDFSAVTILEFELQETNERQDLEELADSVSVELTGDGMETHRENIVTPSGDPGMVLEFRQESEPGEIYTGRMLFSIQDQRFAFVVFYVFTEDEFHRELVEYSLGTLESSVDGKYFQGRVLHVLVVSMERLPELRYSSIDPDNVVRQWSLLPSDPGNELVLVRLKVENHTVDSTSIDVDGSAAELQDLANTTYRPVSIAETVWQDFHGAQEVLVRMDGGQCFDGARALIEPGATVRWQSEDDTPQILAFEDTSVAVGPGGRTELAPGESVSHAFHEPGTYRYVCGNLYGEEWPAEVQVLPAADRSNEALRSVLFLEGPFELRRGYGLDGYMVFETPSATEFSNLRWLAGDSVTIDTLPLSRQWDSAEATTGLAKYADRQAHGPGAVYAGDLTQLAGPAPSPDLGDNNGNVTLNAIEQYRWLYESGYYRELLEKANLTGPAPLTSSGHDIEIYYACINRALPSCRLAEEFWAPNLEERTNGQLRLEITSFPELSLRGTDTLELVSDGTLDMAGVYSGYVAGELPILGIMDLYGLYPDHRTLFESSTEILPALAAVLAQATGGGMVINHNWFFEDVFFFGQAPLRNVADFEGLKIRGRSTPMHNWLEGMGAASMFVRFADVYDALGRGDLEAGGTSLWSAFGQRWYEVTDYMNGPLNRWVPLPNLVNPDVRQRMPADLQKILVEEGAKAELEQFRLAPDQILAGVQKNIDAGMEAIEFSPEVAQHSFEVALMQHVLPGWLRHLGYPARGSDAVALFNERAGPYVGLRIEPDGSVVKASITKGPNAGGIEE